MTSKKNASKASKNGKVTTIKNGVDIDAPNARLVDELKGTFSLEAEKEWYLQAVKEVEAGNLSVNGLRATIEEVEKEGSAPTIKASHAQDFALSVKVRGLKGGEDASLKKVFSACVQARKSFGGVKGAIEKIEASADFDSFVASIPSQGERKRGAGKENADEKKEKGATPDELVKALGASLKAGGKIEDMKALEALLVLIGKETKRLRAKGAQGLSAVA